jgi:redox-sensitive bicupin YhaK (pirin superfamily)
VPAFAGLPIRREHEAHAFWVIEGEIPTGGGPGGCWPGKGRRITLADAPARVMLLGGGRLDGERHIWWNFVSSSKDRIERAKQEWKDGKFGLIPGDDKEFIPLPEPK